jgi:hypothetical protein
MLIFLLSSIPVPSTYSTKIIDVNSTLGLPVRRVRMREAMEKREKGSQGKGFFLDGEIRASFKEKVTTNLKCVFGRR